MQFCLNRRQHRHPGEALNVLSSPFEFAVVSFSMPTHRREQGVATRPRPSELTAMLLGSPLRSAESLRATPRIRRACAASRLLAGLGETSVRRR